MEERWNDTIGDSDIVYHLGDFGFNQNSLGTILPRLKGRKRLILGNHDNGKNPDLQKYFQKISVWRMFPEYDCVLTHVPLHESSMYKVKLNLHGHIHQNPAPTSRHVNCCVELQNYTPRLIEDIITDHSNR